MSVHEIPFADVHATVDHLVRVIDQDPKLRDLRRRFAKDYISSSGDQLIPMDTQMLDRAWDAVIECDRLVIIQVLATLCDPETRNAATDGATVSGSP